MNGINFERERDHNQEYCGSKKSIFALYPLHENGHDFFDTQYDEQYE